MAVVLRTFLILALIALNAFFVTAEYALLGSRRSALEQLARAGKTQARTALSLLSDFTLLISGVQLGTTAASVLLGWLGESILARGLEPALANALPHHAALAAHSIAAAIAFLLITALLTVLGELVPKALAYERAERTAMLVAQPVALFLRLARAPVAALNGAANLVLRALGHHPGKIQRTPPTADEVKLIVSGIRKRGLLAEVQEEMIHGVFDLDRVLVREIMVPRLRITCLPLTRDPKVLLDQIVADQHSRIPIYEGSPDHIVGILYTKDLFAVILDRMKKGVPLESPLALRSILHQPMIVPEAMPLSQMLERARRRRSQMALVVDEFGTFVGIVTIEDVLEQIVGEIHDEYDEENEDVQEISENAVEIDGSLSLRQLEEDYGIALPRDPGYQTVAGFILTRLGVIPAGGEEVVFGGHRFTVAGLQGHRIARVRVERLPLESRKSKIETRN
ncbi:MAG TPA: hemolysin family protein [Terriglobia bacterium]|nr:hemolysin family protein [Terriglobia bacterium]